MAMASLRKMSDGMSKKVKGTVEKNFDHGHHGGFGTKKDRNAGDC